MNIASRAALVAPFGACITAQTQEGPLADELADLADINETYLSV